MGVFFMEWTWPSSNNARNLNAEGYKDILTRYVLSTVEDHFFDYDSVCQHDNAPCHKARSVREWFVDNKVLMFTAWKCITEQVGLQFRVGVRILLIR
jgi:hypothetical protein